MRAHLKPPDEFPNLMKEREANRSWPGADTSSVQSMCERPAIKRKDRQTSVRAILLVFEARRDWIADHSGPDFPDNSRDCPAGRTGLDGTNALRPLGQVRLGRPDLSATIGIIDDSHIY
ncbi:MAG: hypothetical protein U0638_06430 [Phycisphaerales bacterium]